MTRTKNQQQEGEIAFTITREDITPEGTINPNRFDEMSRATVVKIDRSVKKLLKTLDLSNFPNLKILDCDGSSITSIANIPKTLEELNVNLCNNLTTIDLSEATRLKKLDCHKSSITSIANIPETLEELNVNLCEKLTTLDLSEATGLKKLDCYGSSITSIINIPETLEELSVKCCKNLTTLDLSEATGLKKLDCYESSITSITNIPETLEELSVIDCKKLTTLDLSTATRLKKLNCYESSITSIANIPETLEELNVNLCEKLTTLDLSKATGLKKLDCDGSSITSIANIPKTLEELNVNLCNNLTTIDLSEATGLKKLKCYESSITSIANIPETLEELNVNLCKNLATLDLSKATGLKKLDCYKSSITSITNIPETLEELDVGNCTSLTTLDLSTATRLKKLDCHKSSITSIINIPRTLEKINLSDCKNLVQTQDLTTQLEGLEENGCTVTWPDHWIRNKLIEKTKKRLENIISTYNAGHNGEGVGKATPIMLNRYLTESLKARVEENVIKEVNALLDMVEKNPSNLKWINKIAGHFLEGCVNQPVAGFNLIMSWLSLDTKDSLADKIEETRRVMVLNQIMLFIKQKVKDRVGLMVEAEAGNLLFIKIHQKLLEDNIIQTPWIGVPPHIAYEGAVNNWVNHEVKVIYEQVKAIFLDQKKYSPQELVNFILNGFPNTDVTNSEIFMEIAFGKSKEIEEINKKFAEDFKELSLSTDDPDNLKPIPNRFLEKYANRKDTEKNDIINLAQNIFKYLEVERAEKIREFIEKEMSNALKELENKNMSPKTSPNPLEVQGVGVNNGQQSGL